MGCKIGLLGIALVAVTSTAQAQQTVELPTIDVSSSRLGGGITGASTSIITAQDIAHSPGESLQNIIGREAGVQTWSTFGGVNGAGTVVDLRGFGATAASNTLVLINGRRLTDIDIGGVDFSAIPRESIARIEITRGNSGAVLYGDGAVGGVINIVTKTGVGAPLSGRVEGGVGSFNLRELNASSSGSSGPWSASAFGNAINSDGYRVNNELRQRNGIGELRYNSAEGSGYFNISADDQHLGLPGARLVTPLLDLVNTDPRGATTPNDFADKQGVNLTAGVTRNFGNGVELILDGGVRQKDQQAFSTLFGFTTSDARNLTTASFTPRVIANGDVSGMPSKLIAGVDFYNSELSVKRSTQLSDPPIHHYDLSQRSLGVYGQETLSILPTTDLSFGARLQNTNIHARDAFDPTAPGAFVGDVQGVPLNRDETNHALHLGLEHRIDETLTAFGRVAQSFRTPNVDERIGVNAFPVNFDLKTQTSSDAEAGLRVRNGPFEWQSSVYYMNLKNEILFIPFPPIGANINLDPTRRYGVENSAKLALSDTVRLTGAVAYTRAQFREGPNAGNDVPLVSRWTGNIGATWDIYRKQLSFDAVARFIGARRMDNDQTNFQPLIPPHTLVDMRLGGEYKNFFWSAAVQNLFDVRYFDYAVASSDPAKVGTYNAYPMPGRTYWVRAGATF
jgi:iron complex outermembrane receptor protein